MIYKKYFPFIFFLSLFLVESTHAAAMIVNDPLNKIEIIKQVAEAKKQVEAIKEQTALLKENKGDKGFGNVSHDKSIHDYFPKKAEGILDINRHGHKDAAQSFNEILQQEAWSGVPLDRQESLSKRRYKNAVTQKTVAKKAYEASDARIKQIESLMGQIQKTDNPKAIAELQARINLEQAMLENESNKLKLISMMEASENNLIEEHERALAEKMFDPDNTGVPRIR